MNENNANDKIFPKSFFWGASTAAHQVEGGLKNQWSVWEKINAKQLSQAAHERLGNLHNWDKIKDQATDPNNYISGNGVEHYEHYTDDFDLLQKLNMNAFRFGIEWSRLEPEEGKWNEEAIEHYRKYIQELRQRGIEPFGNMWHWTFPVWFAEKGGFKKRSNLKYWRRFVEKFTEEFADDLTYVITLNEPNVYTSLSYTIGEWPPQEKNLMSSIRVYLHLIKAHKIAYKVLKKRKPMMQIGIAAQLANIQAKRPHNMFDSASTKWMRYYWNWFFLKRIRNQQDFVGFNYYFTDYYTGLLRRRNPRVPLNDMGFYMEPEGLYPLLIRLWTRFKKPVYITENGVADAGDSYRRWWIEETLVAMERALSEGVDLRGYFHWSLLDNFEWKFGWWPKFGLVEVDRKNDMKRKIRPSATWFARRIKEIQES